VTPAFDEYKWLVSAPDFSQTSEVNKLNFSLSMQLSACWLRNHNKLSHDVFDNGLLYAVDDRFVAAFNKCHFEGRFQRLERFGVTYFLDGAHTKESMQICVDWFSKQLSKDSINILIFNVTGDRDAALMLSSLHSLDFHHVCFSTNLSDSSASSASENFNGLLSSSQLERCIKHKDIWQQASSGGSFESQLSVCATVRQALEIAQATKDNNSKTVNVLITGSLHLVGSALHNLEDVQAKKEVIQVKRLRSN